MPNEIDYLLRDIGDKPVFGPVAPLGADLERF